MFFLLFIVVLRLTALLRYQLESLEQEIIASILPQDTIDTRSAIIEVRAGTL
jgi:protein subunit release factor A